MKIDFALPEDAGELLKIYAPYVEKTAISFEYEVPDIDEFGNRIRHISELYPYLKATDEDGRILGYAYASAFKERKAYDRSVETSIYVRTDARHGGTGRALYERLEELLRGMGILNMNACIASPKQEDVHLSSDSIHFHHRMGFKDVGVFHDSGYKFNTWYDMIWMEKMIGEHTEAQPEVKFGQYREL